ncbi:MAG TPA: 3-ketoacyl-ACP reductase [Bradyrhizobium sp.]|uniref:3-ketoacyl-ACP reductase n=1 Tax=Bradyrhizobium sp. TaxID=376 RepID=UPI002D808748|nr:3-ketoacyl-ACP reductase [Bradyrhizobium sp.]HET7887216.1 3-ketoacyl-ACP reductase [Bradyrhizobium sp.]
MTRSVALITGARRGIGRAIGVALAKAGYDIAFTDIVEDGASEEALKLFVAAGATARFFRHDVTAIDSHSGLVANVLFAFGRLDLFVSNAGIGAPVRGDMLEITPESFDVVMSVNLRGAAFLSQEVAKTFIARRPERPTMIFVTSASTELVSIDRAQYCVSKIGLSMWAKALAVRLAPQGIAVFEVRPGVIRTDMTAQVAAKYDARIADGLIPAGRWGEGEDVASCVAALAGGPFAYATGTVINADGGLLIPRL